MKLNFKKPLIPNFIATEQGVFPIEQLSEDDLEIYISLWVNYLKENYRKKKEGKEK